jgi:hypothetical protein
MTSSVTYRRCALAVALHLPFLLFHLVHSQPALQTQEALRGFFTTWIQRNRSAVDYFFCILKVIPNFDFSSSFLQRTLCFSELVQNVIWCVVCLSCL